MELTVSHVFMVFYVVSGETYKAYLKSNFKKNVKLLKSLLSTITSWQSF